MRPQEYAKAIIGGVLAGLAVLGTALTDNAVSPSEWVDIAVATLTVFAGVFGLPNAAKRDVISTQTVTVSTSEKTDVPGPDHRADVDGL